MGTRLTRGPKDYFSPGDWNLDCSVCGTKLKASEAERNWQGTWRHAKCNEPRPAQDFVHALRQPEMQVPFIQKMSEGFTQICTLNGISAIPGLAIPGCSIPGNINYDLSSWAPQIGTSFTADSLAPVDRNITVDSSVTL